jgi:hypothetical protein
VLVRLDQAHTAMVYFLKAIQAMALKDKWGLQYEIPIIYINLNFIKK